MASLKLCVLVVACVIVALAMEADCQRRGRGRRREYETSEPDDDDAVPDPSSGNDTMVITVNGRRGGGRRGGGRGRGQHRGQGRGQGRRPGRRGRPGGRPGGRPRPRPGGRGRFDVDNMTPEQQLLIISGLAEATKQFSASLYGQLKDSNTDNFVFSPLSVFTAFSMVDLGSGGRTKRQLRSALGVPRGFQVPVSIKAYSNSLASVDGNAQALSKLANAMYVKPDFNVKRRFVSQLQRFFSSPVEPFAAVDPEDAINDWVEAETDGEIIDFLPDGFIKTDTVMILVNAIYFKGKWKNPFREESTRFGSFSVSETESHQVMMMSVEGNFRAMPSDTLGATVLELPYEGDRYAFYIILPNPGTDLSVVESRLNADTLNTTLNETSRVYPSRYSVTIPKFALDAESSLKEPLQALGAQEVFTPQAHLRKIYRGRGSSESIYVSEAVHRSIIELDEEGTLAAGGTGIGISAVSLPPSFSADRPFVFVLRDNQSGINWFMGRYSNPMGENLRV